MGMVDWAKRELASMRDGDKMNKKMYDHLIHMVKEFSKERHSGFSANYAAGMLNKLFRREVIGPITGEDSEWHDVSEYNPPAGKVYQNKRCSAIFKSDTEKPYYLNAIVWKDVDDRGSWSGSALLASGKKVKSRQTIKCFPFVPKTFYINVKGVEITKDDWEFHVKDEKQLIEVFEYYDEKKI